MVPPKPYRYRYSCWNNESRVFFGNDQRVIENHVGPAIIERSGCQFYRAGVVSRPRSDGPAFIYKGGKWFIENGWQIIDGKPNQIEADGTENFILRFALFDMVFHRLDGPARSGPSGYFWYIRGVDVTEEITQWAIDTKIDLNNLTDSDKMLIKLVWDTSC